MNLGPASQSIRCFACGESLSLDHVGPCPGCGGTQKIHDEDIHESIQAHHSLESRHVHEYHERHKALLAFILFITVASPFLGLVIAGWPGVIVGIVIGLTTFVIGLRAIIKVREIREGQ